MKLRKPLLFGALFMAIIMAVALIRWAYFPGLFRSYLEDLPSVDQSIVEFYPIYSSDSKWRKLEDPAQREELLEILRNMEYGSVYGPCDPNVIRTFYPDEPLYQIDICELGTGWKPMFYVCEADLTKSGFVYELPLLPFSYWINPKDVTELWNFLEAREAEVQMKAQMG